MKQKKETEKRVDKIWKLLHKYVLSWLFLIGFIGGTIYYLQNIHSTGSTVFENLYYVMIYVGGGYALLKMGNWI